MTPRLAPVPPRVRQRPRFQSLVSRGLAHARLFHHAASAPVRGIGGFARRGQPDNRRHLTVRDRSTAARPRCCFWQLKLAHFGSLIWPTLGLMFPAGVFEVLAVYIRNRRRSCGNVESPPVLRGFQGQWKSEKACSWLSPFPRTVISTALFRLRFFSLLALLYADSLPASRHQQLVVLIHHRQRSPIPFQRPDVDRLADHVPQRFRVQQMLDRPRCRCSP
jgi:hypothetical protein